MKFNKSFPPFYRNRLLTILELPNNKKYARKLFPAIQQHLVFKIAHVESKLARIESLVKNIIEMREEEEEWKQQTETPEVLHRLVKIKAPLFPPESS